MNDILAAHFQTVRARVEAEIKPHTFIMVTSATAEDGARLTAFGLAECLAAAGHQTALVDATANPVAAIDGRFKTSGPRDFPIYALPRSTPTTLRVNDTIDAFSHKMREEFDYTIVDAPPFGRQSITVKLAARVDAVIVTVRAGRQPCAADGLMVRALGLAGASVMGVIAATPASIAQFEQSGVSQYVVDARPRASVVPAVAGVPNEHPIRIRQAAL
jgi:Mrp family chromosome partitioning ATPase